MKRGYYISFGERTSVGVNKKIGMQLKQLRQYANVEFIQMPKRERSLFKRIINFLPWIANQWDYDLLFSKLSVPDFVYIRRIEADRKYIHFLWRIKTTYPNCKVLIEIPTYPYEKEYLWSINAIFLVKDLYFRNKLKKYVDRFVTYSQDDVMWGVPTIKTQNGVEVDKIKLMSIRSYSPNEIHLIGVALLQKHHGYERVIQGIGEYYQKVEKENLEKRDIYFHVVGDGPERENYELLAKKLHVEDKIVFHGILQGEELDKIFNQCDIALSVFGMYKQNSNYTSPIKTMEYLAKGIPIISGCAESAFAKEKPSFFLEVSNNRSSINVETIIEFYDRLFFPKGNIDLRKDIRHYAEKNIDMSIVMKPIVDYLLVE